MKRIITSLALILGFVLQGQSQYVVLNDQCQSIDPCNAISVINTNPINDTFFSYTTTSTTAGNNAVCGANVVSTTPDWVYYRFTCYTGGVLNFRITPGDSSSINMDLDWRLYNITATGCSTLTNVAACNFANPSVVLGLPFCATGMAAAASTWFESQITVTAGQTYILGISNNSVAPQNHHGFKINWSGTTATFNDNKRVYMQSILPFDPCSPVTQIKVKLSKPVRCDQLGVGTDFTISSLLPAAYTVAGLSCSGCSNAAPNNTTAKPYFFGNATDTASITFASALAPGTYTISIFNQTAFQSMWGNLDSISPHQLTFVVPSPFKDSLVSKYDCLAGIYRDTIYGKFGLAPYQYKAVGPGVPAGSVVAYAAFGTPTASYNVFNVNGGSSVTYTIRDAGGCEVDTTVTHVAVLPLNAPALNLSASPPCNNQFLLDSVYVSFISNGLPPYTFTLASTPAAAASSGTFTPPAKWKGLVFGNIGTAGGAATFTVTVTDALGCTKTGGITLFNPSLLTIQPANITATAPPCGGDSTGRVGVIATGGTVFYSYSISPSYANTVFTSGSSTTTNGFNNLPSGTYTVTVTDSKGCTVTSSIVVPTSTVFTISPLSPLTQPTCPANCNGIIKPVSVTLSGQKKYYLYPYVGPGAWDYSDSVVTTSATTNPVPGCPTCDSIFNNLCPGTYTVIARSVQGCTATASFTLAYPQSPVLDTLAINEPLCFGGVGSISVQIQAGTTTGTYTNASYTWLPMPVAGMSAAITPPPANGSKALYSGVPAGTYNLIVTNTNQCADTLQVTVTEPSAPVSFTQVEVDSVSCFGLSDGEITLSATGGTPGVNTYQYAIKAGAGAFSAFSTPGSLAPMVYNRPAGVYTIRVRDQNGCTKDTTVTIYQPTQLNLLLDHTVPTCFGTAAGEICVVDTGATPDYEYKLGLAGAWTLPQSAGFVNCFTGLTSGNYTVYTRDANGCLDNLAVNVASIALPVVSFTALPNDTVCDGTAVTLCGTGADSYSWAGAPAITDCASFTPNLGTTTYTVTGTNITTGCVNTAVSNILVNPIPVLTPIPNQVVCNGTSTTAVNFSSTVGLTTYTWTHDQTAAIGIPTSGTTNIPSFTAVNTGNTPLIVTFTVTPTGPAITNCVGADETFTITINPTPIVSDPGDQVICVGDFTADVIFASSVAGSSFSWVNNNTTTGLALFNGNTDILSFQGLNTGSTPNVSTITVTTSANGCPGSALGETFSITVNPNATLTLTSPIATAAQTLCINTPITNIVYSIAGTGNNATVTGLPPSVNGIYNAGVFTISGSPSVAGLYTYTVTATGTCGSTSSTGTIDVTPLQDPSFNYSPSTYCQTGIDPLPNITGVLGGTFSCANPALIINSSTGLIDLSASALGTFTIKYVTAGPCPDSSTFDVTITLAPCATFNYSPSSYCQNGTNPFPVYALGCGGGAFSATPAGLSIDPFTGEINLAASNAGTYTITNFIAAAGGCASASATTSVTIDSTTVLTDPADQIVCNGLPTAAINIISTVGGSTYAWTHNGTGIGIANSGVGNIPSFNAINTGTNPIIVTFTITPTGPSPNFCQGLDQQFTITINPTPVMTDPGDQEICANDYTIDINFLSNVTGTTFSWVNNNNTIGLPFLTGNGDILSFQGLNSGNTPNIGIITVTPSANTCIGASQNFTIQIDPTPVVVLPSNQTVCNGLNTTAVNFVSNVANTTFAWTNSDPTIGLAASGNGNIPAFTGINNGTVPVVATICVTPSGPNPTNCVGVAECFTITINPTPVIVSNADQTLCAGDLTTAYNFNSSVAGTIYNWTNSQSGPTGIGLGAAGVNDILPFVAVNTSNSPLTGNIIVTPSASTCIGVKDTFSITVNPIPVIDPVLDQIVCDNETTTDINFSSNVGGTTFDWVCNTAGIGIPTTGTGDILSFTAINTGTTPIVATITVTPTGPASTNCVGNDLIFTITILPRQDPSFTYALSTYCQTGVNPSPVFTAGTTLGGSFTFTPAGLSINSSTGTINLLTSALGTYTVQYVTPGPCPDSTTFSVTITDNPEGDFTYANTNYCQNTANPLPVFVAPASAGIFSSAPSGLNFVNVNTGEIDLSTSNAGTYTITNIIAASGGCAADTATFTVVIDSATAMTDPTDISVCNGANISSVVFSGAIAGSTYFWQQSNPVLGLATGNGNGNLPAFTAVNLGNTPVTSTFTVTPTGPAPSSCVGQPQTFTITVNPDAKLSLTSASATTSQSICINTPITNITYAVGGTGNNASVIGLPPGTVLGTYNAGTGVFTISGTPNAAGVYTYTVTASGTCASTTSTGTITVNPNAVLTLTSAAATAAQIVCEGSTITNIVYSVTGTGTGASIAWSPSTPTGINGVYNAGVFTVSGSSTLSGIYTYTVTATGSCGSSVLSGSLEITPLQDPTFTYPNPTNCQSGTTSPNFVATAGGTFSATPAGLSINASSGLINLATSSIGTYTIKYVTAGPCKDSTTVVLTVATLPCPTFSYANTNYCQSSANPTVIHPLGCSNGNYTSNPAGVVFGPAVGQINLASSTPGTYDIINTIAASGVCPMVADTFTITITSKPTLTLVSTTTAGCNPNCNGTATTNTTGGNGTYSYAIAPAGGGPSSVNATGVASGLCAGTIYTITVTDGIGCSATLTVTVTTAPSPSLTGTVICMTTPTSNDGKYISNATGGTGTYTFAITPAAAQAPPGTFNGLVAGTTYTVTVTDVPKGCTAVDTFTMCAPGAINCQEVLSAHVNVSCFGASTGSFKDSIYGGTPPYTFVSLLNAASNPVPYLPAVPTNYITASNLPAGTYTASWLDSNNVPCNTVITITQPTQLTFNPSVINTPTCTPGCDGTLTKTANGGTGTKTYSIATPSTVTCVATQLSPGNFGGLGVGTYTITVTDANLCTASTTVQINASPLPTLSLSHTNPSCNNICDGTLTAIGGGGTGALGYGITSPAGSPCTPTQATSGNFSTLGGGVYIIVVTDSKGCNVSDTDTLVNPPAIVIDTLNHSNVSCNALCDANIHIHAIGGTGGITYTLTPPIGGPVTNATGNFIALCAGTYTVSANDANCSITQTVIITQPTALVWTIATANNISCAGSANGVINTSAGGGSGSYNYSLNGGAYQTSGNFNALLAGSYTVTVKDANNCTLSTTFNITEPPLLVLGTPTIVDAKCNGTSTGSITIAANGGTPGYTYSISPAVQPSNSTGVFTGLPAGTYIITVTDGASCTKFVNGIIVGQPAPLAWGLVSHNDVACFGDATGTITVNTQGGTPAVGFTLNPNLGVQAPVGFFSGLPAGTYVVTATDANSCQTTTAVNINQGPQIIIVNVTMTEVLCHGDANGKISFTVIGGTGQLQYQLNGGPSQTDTVFDNLLAGNYTLKITDALGCSIQQIISVKEPEPVGALVSITDALCVDSKDGKAIITGTGGRGGYKYYLTPGLHINKSGIFVGLEVGTYVLRVVDTSGCEYKTTITINPPANPLAIAISKQDLACNGVGNEGTATANVAGGAPPYTYLWNTEPVQTTATASTLYFGFYNVMVVDANGCVVKDTVYIQEGPCCDVSFIPNAFSPNGDQVNDEFRVLTTAGVILLQLEVYNRWGKRVWATNDYRRGWDGTIDGKQAAIDTYYYIFRYKCTRDNETHTQKGDVILIR